MSTAIPRPVLPPLLSWAINDYIQVGQQRGLSPSWLASAVHLSRLLLLSCNDIPVDTIGKQQIDMFWHAFRYWPPGAARRRDLVGCTDTQILTIGFIEARPAPSPASYALAQNMLRAFFAWLQQHSAILRAPCEFKVVIKHKPAGQPPRPMSRIQAMAHGAQGDYRPPAAGQTTLPAWKRSDLSPLANSTLSNSIDKFIGGLRADGMGAASLRSYVNTLRVLFAALGDLPMGDITGGHLERFWQLYNWWPQNRSPCKIDTDALMDSQLLDIGRRELTKPPSPSVVAKSQGAVDEFFGWSYREKVITAIPSIQANAGA